MIYHIFLKSLDGRRSKRGAPHVFFFFVRLQSPDQLAAVMRGTQKPGLWIHVDAGFIPLVCLIGAGSISIADYIMLIIVLVNS